ncbi:hypothetical protein [Fusibacter tunisiensis]|uniref:Uncharacterized protein n=1 Tax=Fusibacter tunisiensis TaxID=1008308 RepID=A0ABS2MT88_9FIRM|nr:hypothetical protein [Fusibacter tunisiensis]MBM7562605.1 hypothetical protein [Fusibacter tunisiensis]
MYYPNIDKINSKDEVIKENLAIQLYGKRIYEGQTVGEYLLEFLLVFLGCNDGKGGFNLKHGLNDQVKYITNPNIGLKRFIFFENSKNENRHDIDRMASDELNRLLMENIDSEKFSVNQVLYQIKDLFYGFNLITKQRSWFAQSMMPLCKDLVFCEAQNNTSRKRMDYYPEESSKINSSVDKDFAFTKHSFLGRGGEVYYMHLLQGLQEMTDASESLKIAVELDNRIRGLLSSFPHFEVLSKYIQNKWNDYLTEHMHKKVSSESKNWVQEYHVQKMDCHWIKSNYVKAAPYSIKELRNILSSTINPLEKLELINIGIILQMFRLMINEAYFVATGCNENKPVWLVQVPAIDKVNPKVKMMAVKYYSKIENYMTNALSIQLDNQKAMSSDESSDDRNADIKKLKDAYKNSHKLMRKIGKDIGLITPITGQNMRFTITDDIMRYLVLSLIEPSTSITLDSFLAKLYEHYGIVIREEEYTRHYRSLDSNEVYAPSLIKNLEEFTIQLRNNGYLKELSDATAIVMNPYDKED